MQRKLALSSFLLLLLLGSPGWAEAPKHMGVASCSSSNCHGSVSPRKGTHVLQNEYVTWNSHGAHSKAWVSLTNQQSQTIGRHLGIADVSQDPMCLACHATYVPDPAQRGEKYRVEDGVSCESCHGAAEKYLGPHTANDATLERNHELGMRALHNVSARAGLCLECHLGTQDKTVDHRLIGAGHPRLSFELDTFTALMPAHWEVDDDYRKRKGGYEATRAWLAGQVERSRGIIESLRDPTRSRVGNGILASPELSLLYCFNCHHSLTEEQYKARNYDGRPGELKLNLSSLIIVSALADKLPDVDGKAIRRGIETLHRGETDDAAIDRTLSAFDRVKSAAESAHLDRVPLLRALVEYGAENPHLPYEVAEQVAMGASALLADEPELRRTLKRSMDALYDALAAPFEFKADQFTKSAQALAAQLR